MSGILDDIVAAKKRELVRSRRAVPLAELRRQAAQQAPALDFAAALKGGRVRIIAEVKKASPSRGLLVPDLDPVALAQTYARNGAAAISVLTEAGFFQGSLDFLRQVRRAPGLKDVPLLRKDFIFAPYQVYESRAAGADAILLIVAILADEQLKALLGLAGELGMQCLVEVHDAAELVRALAAGAGLVGINNRDLRTFRVDLATTRQLRPLVPDGVVLVSESGIGRRQDIEQLAVWGVDAALVGEALVTAPDVAARLRELA